MVFQKLEKLPKLENFRAVHSWGPDGKTQWNIYYQFAIVSGIFTKGTEKNFTVTVIFFVFCVHVDVR